MYIKLFAKWQSNVFLVVLLSLLSSSSCSSYSASFSGCRCILFLIFSCAVVYSFVYVIPSCASSFITHSLTHSPVAHCCYRLLCLLNLICRVLLFSPVIYHQYKIGVYSNHFCLTVYFHFQALWLFSFCSFYFVVSTVPMICACIFVVLCWQRCLGVYKYTQTKYHQIDKWASIARVSERTNEGTHKLEHFLCVHVSVSGCVAHAQFSGLNDAIYVYSTMLSVPLHVNRIWLWCV